MISQPVPVLSDSFKTTIILHLVFWSSSFTAANADAAPINDLCANAIEVVENAATVDGGVIYEFDSTDATFDDSGLEPCNTPYGAHTKNIFYKYTIRSCDMTSITVHTGGSSFDTKMIIYKSTAGCDDLTCLAGRDDTAGYSAQTAITLDSTYLTIGDVIYIMVFGFQAAAGPGQITVIEEGSGVSPCSTPTPTCSTPDSVGTGPFQITDVTCDRNNGDKHDDPFNIVINIANAHPNHRVAIKMMGWTDFLTLTEEDDPECSVCAEWDNKLEVYSRYTEDPNALGMVTLSALADENGNAKMRLPTQDCDYATVGVAVMSRFADTPSDGHCTRTDYGLFGEFEGFHFTLELPKFTGTPDSQQFLQVLKEFALHNLLSNDEDGVYDHEDVSVSTDPHFHPFLEFTHMKIDDQTTIQGNAGSVYAHYAVPAMDYDHAFYQLHHIRNLFGRDGSTKGLSRRSNTNGSQKYEKELQKRMNAAGLDASMGNILLVDSGIYRKSP